MFLFKYSFLDAAMPYQIGMQDSATPIMEGIVNFHNHIMFFLVAIAVFVFWLLARCLALYNSKNNYKIDNFTHSTVLEIVWTVVPAIILMIIAVPSFALLYSMDEMLDPSLTFKVIGHQWFWSYEFSDYNHATKDGESLSFDSYMIAEEDLALGSFRLLEVDNRVVLPTDTHIRVLITAADVLHSWAVPSFGIKIDACPGRLNQGSLFIKRTGAFYGQCSEICGVNHGFMPICVESVSMQDYKTWVETKLNINLDGNNNKTFLEEKKEFSKEQVAGLEDMERKFLEYFEARKNLEGGGPERTIRDEWDALLEKRKK